MLTIISPVGSIMVKGTRRNRAPQRQTRKTRKPRGKKATVALVKQVLNRSLETKYVATQVQLAGFAIPGDITPSADYHFMLPAVSQQTTVATSNTREGDTIEPIRAKISGHIWYNNVDNPVGNIVFVKLFFCTNKSIKDSADLTSLPDGLLEDGSADPVRWVAAKQDLQAFYPVCKENYTVLKTKTFKFVKNGGLPVGNQPTHTTNIGQDRYAFSYSWTPPKLKYALDASTYPSNHAPFMFCVAYSPGYNYATDASLTGTVIMNWNLEMSYKDA